MLFLLNRLFFTILVTFSCAAFAEVKILMENYALPRADEIEQLTISFTIDNVLPSDYDLQDGEASEWDRLRITLPDSEDKDLPLAQEQQNEDSKSEMNSHYHYEPVLREQEEETNADGNLTINFIITIKARKENNLHSLIKGDSNTLRVKIVYRKWEMDVEGNGRYGGALADVVHSFARIDAVPNSAPTLVELEARHRRLQLQIEKETLVELNNNQGEKAVAEVVVFVVKQSDTPLSLTPIARVYKSVAEGGDIDMPADEKCEWLSDCSIDCPRENVYFDLAKATEIPALQHSKLTTTEHVSISNLEIDTPYQVILQYHPDGIVRSECATASPVENKTLMELNGEEATQEQDLRCFIATAAYGSDFFVSHFRWFRDNFLLTNTLGSKFVSFYYRHSPLVAAKIANNQLLKITAQFLLLLPLFFIFCLKQPLVFISLFLLTIVVVARLKVFNLN